jgi:hypothetical protein
MGSALGICYADAEFRLPLQSKVNCKGLAWCVLWYPTQAKTRLDPDFLYAAPSNGGVCGFLEESRMNFINANKLHRKSGGMGHPSFVADDDGSAYVSFRLVWGLCAFLPWDRLDRLV